MGDIIFGVAIALAAVFILSCTHACTWDIAQKNVIVLCTRDGFVWMSGERYDCAKTKQHSK